MLLVAEKREDRSQRITVGADKTHDASDFVVAAPPLNGTPHITKNEKARRSNIDGGTTRHPGYGISLSCRWLVEKAVQPRKPSIVREPMVISKQVVAKCPKGE